MTAAADAGFVSAELPRRHSAAAAPLSVWVRTVLVCCVLFGAFSAWLVYRATPMPAEYDTHEFTARFNDFDRQVTAIRAAGDEPLTIVFLGTSRIRNVAFDAAEVAAAARDAGIARPVASTVLGVNWGGFERFGAALPMIEARRPDVIVIMPELLLEDFTPSTRLAFGRLWLGSGISGRDYLVFGQGELERLVCSGFVGKAGDRWAEADRLVAHAPDSAGPEMGRSFLKRMAAAGTKVLVAEVPVTGELAALRPPAPGPDGLMRQVGLADAPGIEPVSLTGQVSRSAYCDYAHIDPDRAAAWQQPFFRAASGVLNRPRPATALR